MSFVPSPVDLYFRGIVNFLSTSPFVVNYAINRRRVGDVEGFIVIDVDLVHSYRLSIMEYFRILDGVTRYRYHLMDQSNNPILRWDNAPHHSEITTFPHHVHRWDSGGLEIIDKANQLELFDIILKIEEYWNSIS